MNEDKEIKAGLYRGKAQNQSRKETICNRLNAPSRKKLYYKKSSQRMKEVEKIIAQYINDNRLRRLNTKTLRIQNYQTSKLNH